MGEKSAAVRAEMVAGGIIHLQWICWIIVQILQIIMFSGISDLGVNINVIVLRVIILGYCFQGAVKWHNTLLSQDQSQAQTQIPVHLAPISGSVLNQV